MFGIPSNRRIRRDTQAGGHPSGSGRENRRARNGIPPPGFHRQRGKPRGAAVRGEARRDRLRRFLVRRRRLLAGLLAALACGIAVEAYLPPDARTVLLLTADGDLPAGHVLQPGDLRLSSLPAAASPPGAFSDSGTVAGKRLAVPLRAGTALTDSYLVGPGLLTGSPEGTAAVPLRTADPAAAGLLSPGVLVDVMLAAGTGFDGAGFDGGAEATLLAAGVPVLWIADGTAEAGATWPGSGNSDAGLVVVAARGQDAAALAGASERGNLYLVLSGD